MSSARDISAELECPTSGQNGTPVDAHCAGCDTARAKYAPEKAVRDDHSFRSYCPECVAATYWHIDDVIEGIDA